MSAETFTTAMFLITAVIAAGVLINAVFPIIYNMAETFTASTHASDVRLRTDFVIVTTFASSSSQSSQVWMKNVGSQSVSMADIQKADVFCGSTGNFNRLTYGGTGTTPSPEQWTANLADLNNNNFWDPGETLQISAKTVNIPSSSGSLVYFQFVLPNGISRTIQFTAS